MDYLPVGLRLTQRPCLIVGGGDVAARKAQVLLRAGARLRVVAPAMCEAMHRLSSAELETRPYVADDLSGMAVAVAATGDRAVNRAVSQDAKARGVPVNVVDAPELCTFVMPALIDRDPILVGVWSSGAAPVLSREIRGQIEALLPDGLGALAAILGRHRSAIKTRFPDLGQRRAFVEALLTGPVAEAAYAGQLASAEAALIRSMTTWQMEGGSVALIAVGPGQPELLTLRAQRTMQQADRVLHDPTVTAEILDRCRRDAHVGPIDPTSTPAQLAAELSSAAAAGQRVAVLRPGHDPDPGAQVTSHLQQAGVRCSRIPGVSSA